MSTKNINIKTILITVVAIAVLLWSVIGIDYSGLATFSMALVTEVFSGLAHPDRGFVYDGSGEDLLSLLLLTIEIAFLGTVLGVILAIPVALVSSRNLWNHAPWISKIGKIL